MCLLHLFSLELITSGSTSGNESWNLTLPLRPMEALSGIKFYTFGLFFHPFCPWTLKSVPPHLCYLFICHSSPFISRCWKLTWFMDHNFPAPGCFFCDQLVWVSRGKRPVYLRENFLKSLNCEDIKRCSSKSYTTSTLLVKCPRAPNILWTMKVW